MMKGAHSSEGEDDNASAAWAHAWLLHHCKERSEFKLKVETSKVNITQYV